MIGSNAYLHLEDKKLKKTDKIDSCFKKMILIEYRDHSIYCLYDRKSNLIFVSCSVDVNKSSMLKNLTTAEAYKVESSTAEPTKFGESSAVNKQINKLIFKHM